MKTYDYVIVGAGLFGSIFAREMTDAGKKCLVVEKRNHIGGNCYSKEIEGIHVSQYGGHIFHTNNERVWNYVNKYTEFEQYHHKLGVNYKGKLFSFPINLMTFYQLYGITSPSDVMKKLEEVRVPIKNPDNLEDWALSQVGKDLYETFIKGYTKKQWNMDPRDLPTSIIKRIPIRTTYNDCYFSDKFQGWPKNGYTDLFVNLLKGIDVSLNTDFFANRAYFESIANKIVYTGKVDQYFDYCHGDLAYRGLRWDNQVLDGDFQGSPTINYTDEQVPYTRIIEHKHFQPRKALMNPKTLISIEYPDDWSRDKIPYYPINDEKNSKRYKEYFALKKQEKHAIFGGRLAEYKYYDMHMVVGSALTKVKKELK